MLPPSFYQTFLVDDDDTKPASPFFLDNIVIAVAAFDAEVDPILSE